MAACMPPAPDPQGNQMPAKDCGFSCHLTASDTSVRATLVDLRNWMNGLGVSHDVQGSVELVIAEALNNIVEHAYKNAPAGDIRIQIEHAQSDLQFSLMDQGHAMPGLSPPDTSLPSTTGPLEDFPEGGFGWYLIRQLTTDLHYHRKAGQNHLCFRISINPDS